MRCQHVTLSGDAEWPKVADAVIEAGFRLRKVVKAKPQKTIKETDAIFANIKKRMPRLRQREGSNA